LAPIKVACCGVVAFKLASPSNADAAISATGLQSAQLVHQAVAALLADVDGGKQPRLQHVQRIVPIQATCRLESGPLQEAGARLAALAAASLQAAPGAQAPATADSDEGDGQRQQVVQQQRRVTFGIALKHRTSSEVPTNKTSAKPQLLDKSEAEPIQAASAGDGTQGSEQPGCAATAASSPPATSQSTFGSNTALDRGAIIAAVARGFDAALREQHGVHASVDLKAPDLILVVEVLPAAGALYAVLCVLPRALCVVKPKLHIRPVGKAGL
jgi:hypothetical protein